MANSKTFANRPFQPSRLICRARHHGFFRAFIILGVIAVVASALVTVSLRAGATASMAHEERLHKNMRDKPAWIERPRSYLYLAGSSPAGVIRRTLLKPRVFPREVSTLTHLLRLRNYAIAGGFAAKEQVAEALQLLTNEEVGAAYFGRPIIYQTRDGIRYGQSGMGHDRGESHRDLCLCTFGEMGLPLSTTLNVAGRTYQMADVLTDSLAHFSLKQEEIAWTAEAYVFYLKPSATWLDADGSECTFDRLAKELIARPLDAASCGGTHLLNALSVLLQVDTETKLLSPDVREEVLKAMRNHVKQAVVSQRDDGAWNYEWWKPTDAIIKSDDVGRFLVTGHLTEWMTNLPIELRPANSVLLRSSSWLCTQIENMDAHTGAVSTALCPWTHAVTSVANLVEPSFPSTPF